MKTVFNTKIDLADNPLFLGEDLGLQRYDKLKYPKLFKLAEAQEEFFWRATEISLVKDRSDYKDLTDTEKFIFDSNLRWQTMTDSMLSRSLLKLSEYVSNTELEACMNVWAFFESNIHSRAYSHILKNVYPDESVFWDSILNEPEIIKRAKKIKEDYDALFNNDSDDIKTKIFNAIVSTNITESLSFYVSFAVSFFFGVRGSMEGNAKIIRFIERDERLHAAVTTFLIQTFKNVKEEGFTEIYKQNESKIVEGFKLAANIEKEWAEYLFSKGNLLGLSKEQLQKFIEYKCNERFKLLDLKPCFEVYKANPLGSWYDEFLDTSKQQVAPQESEITSYKIGARNSDINQSELSSMSL